MTRTVDGRERTLPATTGTVLAEGDQLVVLGSRAAVRALRDEGPDGNGS